MSSETGTPKTDETTTVITGNYPPTAVITSNYQYPSVITGNYPPPKGFIYHEGKWREPTSIKRKAQIYKKRIGDANRKIEARLYYLDRSTELFTVYNNHSKGNQLELFA